MVYNGFVSEQLLKTKLYTPTQRPLLVQRPHLIQRLNNGLNRKLSLISAPAGFGKTTLVVEWLSQVERPFTWVSLDEDDNNVHRLFTYMAAAVQKIEGTGNASQGLLLSPQPASVKALATAFINDCLTVTSPFMLILDDFHVIEEPTIFEAVSYLIDHMPPSLHLVITSRTDPLLPLSRLRARSQLTELRSIDLRFSIEEVVGFLQGVMGLSLSEDEVQVLETRTEGWIAGLQMAALSIQGFKTQAEVSAFVSNFAGSHRYIFDYLTDEVLRNIPPDTQTFLLQTSILKRLHASLCTAVTGERSSRSLLQSLENANMFLFPLDENRTWYRYHHLFADLLRIRLQNRNPDLIPTLYQRASQWYAKQGKVETAVQYALAGDDIDGAAHLLDRSASDFIMRSEIRKFLQLAKQFPFEIQRQHPQLCLALGWALMFGGEFDKAEVYIKQSEAIFLKQSEKDNHVTTKLNEAHTATVRAYIATRQGKLSEAVAFSQEALSKTNDVPEEMSRPILGTIMINLGQTQIALDELDQAETSLHQAVSLSKANGRLFGTMAAYAHLMKLLQRRGQLIAAKSAGLEGLAWLEKYTIAGQQIPAEGEVRIELARILYEQNELTEAKKHLKISQDLYRFASPYQFARSLHYLFLIAFAQGDLDVANDLHEQIEPVLNELSPNGYRNQQEFRSERIKRLSILQPKTASWREELQSWIKSIESGQSSTYSFHQKSNTLTAARVYAALDQPEISLAILNQLAGAANTAGRLGDVIHVLVQQAIVFHQMAQEETAVFHLSQALDLAQSRTYLRVFLGEADTLYTLLPQLPATLFRDELITHINQETHPSTLTQVNRTIDQSQLIDPLSKREFEVLTLLASHLSGPEIANQLHISTNTFKTHTKNIYSKLGVKSRNGAVLRAKELGLL